jgi:tetratricopeptide (TPR) repeat protein
MSAATEAASLYARLAAAHPAEYSARHAHMLGLLAHCHGDLGQYEDAVNFASRSVDLYRDLAAGDPGSHGFRLAEALQTLTYALGGRRLLEQAVRTAEEHLEAVRHAASEQNNGPMMVVTALILLDISLAEAGRTQEALNVLHTAVTACDEFAVDDTRQAHLAVLWEKISHRLSDLARHDEAQHAERIAARLRTQLAVEHPVDADDANQLMDAAARLMDAGLLQRALATFEQVAEAFRRLAASVPEDYQSQLAVSLLNLATCSSKCGRRSEAVHLLRQVVQILKPLSGTDEKWLSALAIAFHNLGVDLALLGKHIEALRNSREAVRIRRDLVTRNGLAAEAHRVNLARSLANLGIRLSEAGLTDEALKTTAESVFLRRYCAQRNPALSPELGTSLLGFVSVRLSADAHMDQALQAATEAVSLFETLAGSNATRYVRELQEARQALAEIQARLRNLPGRTRDMTAGSKHRRTTY